MAYGGAWAQSIKSGPVPAQKRFTSPVDQLDEFIDRFNHQDPMFLEAFPNRPQRPAWAERAYLIKTLINPQARLDAKLVDAFVRQVCTPADAQLLALPDSGWYAALSCSLKLDGRPAAARLIFRFERDTNGVQAWRLLATSLPAPVGGPAPLPGLAPDSARPRKGLNPAAHGNGFIALHRAFLGAETFSENLSAAATPQARRLAALVEARRLKLDRVSRIVYHFLQVEGYLFTVSDVTAPEGAPSGFLINKLTRLAPEAKQAYRKRLLGT